MFLVISLITLALAAFVLFLYYSKIESKLSANRPWLWKNICLPIFNYLFVTSVRKVTITYFHVMAGCSISFPINRFIIHLKHRNISFGALCEFNGSTFDWLLFCIACFSSISYIIYIIYETKKLKTSQPDRETLTDVVTEVVHQVGRGSSDLIRNILPQLQHYINQLHIVDALSILESFREYINTDRIPDWFLLSKVDYLIGMCSKYTDAKRCRTSLIVSFDELAKCGKYDSDIFAGRLYVAIRDNDKNFAKEIIKTLKERTPNNKWITVAELYFSSDFITEVSNLKGENKDYISALLLELGKREVMNCISVSNYEIPKIDCITIENYCLWPFYLSVLLTRFVQKWSYQPWGISLGYKKESDDLYELSERYYKLLNQTQMKNNLVDLDFTHAFVAYNHDQNPLWIEKMKGFKYTLGMKDIYFLMLSSMLIHEGKNLEAAQRLASYGDDANAVILQSRLNLALRSNDINEIKNIYQFAVEHIVLIKNEELNFFATCLQVCANEISIYIPQLNIEDIISKKVLIEICNYYLDNEIDIDLLLHEKSNIHNLLKPYVALIFNKAGLTDEGIELVEPILSMDYYDIRTHVYITLLRQDQKYNSKLYNFIGILREHNIATDDLLQLELSMSEKMQDFERSLIISTILHEKYPENGSLMEHYIMALVRTHKYEKLEEISKDLNKLDYPEACISNIFNAYLISGFVDIAVQFLYKEIEKTNSQSLKDLFYQIRLNKDIDSIIMKQYDVVSDDSYLLLDVNGKEEFSEITKGSHYEALIGKHVGENIEIELFKGLIKITIKAVFNKYFKLIRETTEDIAKNKSKTIQSFTIDDLTGGDGLIANMRKLSGHGEEYLAEVNKMKETYKKGETTLYSLINDYQLLSDVFDHLFGSFEIRMKPTVYVSQQVQHIGYDIKSATPVLELTGLIMLQELSIRFKLKFEKKFIIAKALQVAIDDCISKEKNGYPSGLSTEAIENMTFIHKDHHYVLSKLTDLKEWVTSNCLIESDEEILNHDFSSFDRDIARLHLITTILAHKPGRILLTEDWFLTKINFSEFQAVSVCNWLALMGIGDTSDIQIYLANCHFIGCYITADYICEQYYNRNAKKKNHFDYCLTNIKENPVISEEVNIAVQRILSGITDASDKLIATQMLASILMHFPYETANMLAHMSCKAYPVRDYIDCMKDAFRIAHPFIL